jgi:hypothetical protein
MPDANIQCIARPKQFLSDIGSENDRFGANRSKLVKPKFYSVCINAKDPIKIKFVKRIIIKQNKLK